MKQAKRPKKEFIVGFFTMDRIPASKKRDIRKEVKAALGRVGSVRKVECYGPMKGPRNAVKSRTSI